MPLSTDLIREFQINQNSVYFKLAQNLTDFLAASSSRTPVKTSSRIQQSLQGTPNETKIRQLEAKLAGIYNFRHLYPNRSLLCHINHCMTLIWVQL